MKHQNLIDAFVAKRDENDGYCDIIWLPAAPGLNFNNVLPGPCTDILGAYLDIDDGFKLRFLISSPDDREQEFATLQDFPFHLQKLIYNYIF